MEPLRDCLMTAASARTCKIWSLSASTRSTGTGPSTKIYSRIHSSRRAHLCYFDLCVSLLCAYQMIPRTCRLWLWLWFCLYSICYSYLAQVRVLPQGRARIVHHRGLASRSKGGRWRRPVALSVAHRSVTAACVIASLHLLGSERRLLIGDSSLLLPWPRALKAPLLSALFSPMVRLSSHSHSHLPLLLFRVIHSAPLNLLFF